MKKTSGFKGIASLTALIIILGGLLFTVGFGVCLYLARQEVTSDVDKKIQRDIDYLNSFIDGQLQRVEDAGYSFSSLVFGDVVMENGQDGYVELDDSYLHHKPSPDELYKEIEKFMRATPILCGIAIEFEPYVYPEINSQYGFTPYVTNVSGDYNCLDLGEITNSFEWEWYTATSVLKHGHWCNPFKDSSIGHVIACYAIPVLKNGQPFAIIAVDIDTESFSSKSTEISPYPGAQVSLLDRDFNFVSNTDKSLLLKNVSELEGIAYSADENIKKLMESRGGGQFDMRFDGTEYMMYFSPVPRTDWMITIQCPKQEIYGAVDRMKKITTLISLISVLIMTLVLTLVFHRFRNVSMKEAGIEKELNVAANIQAGMLPQSLMVPDFTHQLDVFGYQKPAKTVGGDLYDYFTRDNKFFFCIGDVSGKGIPASLYMVVILALFRNVTHKESDPGKIATEINNTLVASNNYSMFCTMFFGVLDMDSGKLEYCNAGHNKPMVCRNSDFKVSYKDVNANLALGVMDNFPYTKEEMHIAPGDSFFLYTDGLTEAEDEEKALFGDDAALEAFGRSVKDNDSKNCINGVLQAVVSHSAKAEQNDDITMLVIEYKGPSSK